MFTIIEAASKVWCVNNGKQTKGNTNRKFRLASLLQVTKSAPGCIANKSIGTGMTKSASVDEIKCLTGTKKTMSIETATLTVTTARDKAVAMTDLSIKFYPIQKKSVSFLSLSLPSFLFPSSPSSTKRKVEIVFVGIEMSVLVFLFGVLAIAKPDKILKY